MSRCIIIAAGDLTVGSIDIMEGDYVIAVDGGLEYAALLGVEPDVIIGDFDSVSEEYRGAVEDIKKAAPEKVITLPVSKDDTDTLAAIKHGLSLGYERFLLYAAGGGRMEHTLANIQCLLYLKEHGATGYLMDGGGMTLVLRNEKVAYRENLEGYLSILSLTRESKGVTVKGLKYELDNATITNAYPLGISNEFIGKMASVEVTEGDLLVVVNFVTGEED